MKNKFIPPLRSATWLVLALLISFSCSKRITGTQALPVEKGVSGALAEYRKKVIRDLTYRIHLQVPAQKAAPIQGQETITFYLTANAAPLQLDFKEKTSHLRQVVVNKRKVPVDHRLEHLLIPRRYLKTGKNQVDISFTAGDLSLNRSDDFLYTLLVPDRARTVFPVFDQPNLKATFTLSLTLPQDWKALANGPVQDSVITAGQKTYHFAPSDIIPTYLFAFVAGKFSQLSRQPDGRPMLFLHRETDPRKLQLSLEPIFSLHARALAFMQDYTGIPYPFRKFDFAALPDFQYGGMEHVGAIDYKASTLFLDEGATQDQQLARSSLIAHETAHMWFGNLVTMDWFNDVWMKEVFANFMADKITQVTVANTSFDLKFLVDHFPAAYSVDRSAGANPIRQQLDNLQDAGSLYGNIIYHKAPIMMRQLERLMGPGPFQAGLQEYLRRYANDNATWPDLIQLLDARTPADLQAWNQVWVNQPGRPVFNYELSTQQGRISRLLISQQAEDGSDRIWPQLFEITLVYPHGRKELTVEMNQRQVTVPAAQGEPAPAYILFNSSGQGYGVFPITPALMTNLYTLPTPVARASAYISLYENMLNGRGVTPRQLLDTYRQGLTRETEELNLKLLSDQLSDIFWQFLTPQARASLAPALEKELWDALLQHPVPNARKLLLKTYQSIALSKDAQYNLYRIWEKEKAPASIKLSEEDYTALALALAVRDYATENPILERQLGRIRNADRRKRLQFLLPALSPDVRDRDAFFAGLKKAENREKESWVVAALSYLHHPLRAATSEKYLAESLDLLQEIQLTGDIFFPYNWLQSTFGAYQSAAAAQTVRAFLQAHPDYNPKLKAKILQAADDLFRAEKILKSQP